ncbi:MAG: adhesin, partial [Bacteroides sp.]|nr:adhesin [Bacteroides sp.]
SGQYTVLGEKNSWGGKDRDVMTLNYTIEWANGSVQVTDKLVQWSRGVASEWFEVAAK